nr:PREDICTED: uncharacterized protein LOC109036035 [Bemisia tabaci]
MPKEEIKFACTENVSLLRNKSNYEADVKTNNVSLTGIKETCYFNKISEFFVLDNTSFEVMHDCLKGIFVYDLVEILNNIISLPDMSLKILNDRLENYDFGPIDSGNRPLAIYAEELSGDKLKMTAAEIIVFTTHLGLIIGDKVPEGDPFWELYSFMRQIMDIVFSPSISLESVKKISSLVEGHNSLYLMLSGQSLKPKFHNLLHYQTHFEKFGPLIHLWAMRFEAKHRQSKMAGNVIACRKNLTYSLSLKHQLQFMSLLLSDFEKPFVELSPKAFWIKKNDIELPENVSFAETVSEELLSTAWVKYNGIPYAEGSTILYDTENDLPKFFHIQSIYANESDDVLFVCRDILVSKFDAHYHAYKIELLDSSSIIEAKNIKIHSYCNISVVPNGQKFITLRHKW